MRPASPVDSVPYRVLTVAAVVIFAVQVRRETPRKPPTRFVVVRAIPAFVLFRLFKNIYHRLRNVGTAFFAAIGCKSRWLAKRRKISQPRAMTIFIIGFEFSSG